MKVGLLWFDDDPRRPFEVKVEEAVERYAEKFGERPNACFVNPRTLPEGVRSLAGVTIRASATVLPNHFWVGVGRNGQSDGEGKTETRDRTRSRVVA